ncbi:MAG: hypothetical protein VX938_09625, partial [Myxococcota bacterium]|nr:hypothetical protein [Myxococcota bacterium]
WVSEASIEGWFVVSDAGHGGDAVWISPGGDEVQEVSLPLDEGAGDDLEGLGFTPDGHLVALTSGGYLRKWMFSQGEPVISLLAQPISDDPFWRCDDPEKANCDPDYEGLCLDPSPRSGSCAGFAVSKERGLLVCLVPSGASYVVDDERTITVGEPGQLSGCSYELESPHRLIAAGNDKADGRIWEVRSPRDLDRLEIRPLGVTGPDGQEAAAFGPDGLLLLIGDTQDPEETAAPTGAAQCQ